MTEDSVVLISSDGDAILIVHDESQEDFVRIRVNTHILQASSKVFKAMFGPKFAEGQRLDKQHPPEILLQDDPYSMKIVCQVLHFHNDSLPDILEADDVLRLAKVVDKYELQEAMKLAMDMWLQPNSAADDLILLLEAAMILKHEGSFQAITRNLIMDCKEQFLCTSTLKIDNPALLKILIASDQKRATLRTDISNTIFSQAQSIGAGCQCHRMGASSYNFMQKVYESNMTPTHVAQMSVARAVAKLEMIGDPIVPKDCVDSYSRHASHTEPRYIREKLRIESKQVGGFSGLRLKDFA